MSILYSLWIIPVVIQDYFNEFNYHDRNVGPDNDESSRKDLVILLIGHFIKKNGFSTEEDVHKTFNLLPYDTLSVTNPETMDAVICVQYIMLVNNIIKSIGLDVELSIRSEINNKGYIEMAHNFSVEGRTKHIEIRTLWIRKLREK